jgi:hypothetical protein
LILYSDAAILFYNAYFCPSYTFTMPVIGSIIKSAIELRGKVPSKITAVNPVRAQKRTLKKLLRKAQLTSFGEEYGFSDILRGKNVTAAFAKKVPAFDYSTIFRQWWYRTLNGEPYVCWPGKVKYFALSSGTSEASSKYIPVTSDMLRAIKKTSIRQLFTLAQYDFPNDFFEKGILMLGGSTHLQYNGTYYEGDLSGITAGNIPFWFEHHYKPGKRISRERDWQTKLEEIVRNAPRWDIGVIVGVPAWLQILLEKIIERYQLKTIHDIWPNLSIFVHGGVAFAPYAKGFEKLLARPLTYIETYLASEGFVAFQARPNTMAMQLVLNNGLYFEFVPFNDTNFDTLGNLKEQPEAIGIGDVEEGKEYALLLSSCSGAWRYLIGDTIKFVSKKHSEILITGRTKHFLSICGEHLSLENLTRAISLTEDELGVNITEFGVSGIKLEKMFAHQWYLGTDDTIDPENARSLIDKHLKVLNDDYRVERLEAIRDVLVEVLPKSVFYDFMKMKGREGGQNKFPRVLKDSIFNEWKEYVNKYKAAQNKR